MKKRILGVTGLPGAGKTMLCDAVHANSYEVFSCGEIVKEETMKRGPGDICVDVMRPSDYGLSWNESDMAAKITLDIS